MAYINEPLKPSGALDAYESFMTTPVLGQEYPKANIVEMLREPNSDDILRDLAIVLAERGVVFFRGQTNLSAETHKEFIRRLGEVSGRPKENGLYQHPISKAVADDDKYHHILDTSRLVGSYDKTGRGEKRQSARVAWHNDSTYENHPPDYTSLRITTIPLTGGDTLWASGYEVYDRLSASMQKALEACTATFTNTAMIDRCRAAGQNVFEGPRGSPANVGSTMTATHPVIRTHPVTGWKSVFGLGVHCRRINGLTPQESTEMQTKLASLIMENHDLQCRFRWEHPGDIAIWDNRCSFHAPTGDQIGRRIGWRVVAIGEKPYLDPNSLSRDEALAQRHAEEAQRKEQEAAVEQAAAPAKVDAALDKSVSVTVREIDAHADLGCTAVVTV